MVSAEQDQKHANGRGKEHQPVFSKRVGQEETTAVAHSKLVSALLIMTVERCKVTVGGPDSILISRRIAKRGTLWRKYVSLMFTSL